MRTSGKYNLASVFPDSPAAGSGWNIGTRAFRMDLILLVIAAATTVTAVSGIFNLRAIRW